MTQRIKGLAAVVLIGTLMIGVPTALIWAGAGFFPTSLPSMGNIWKVLSQPDDGTLIMGVLLVAGWLAWAYLMVGILAEIWAAVRRIQAPKLPGFALPQGLARKLVGAAMLVVATAPALAGTSHASPAPSTIPTTQASVNVVQTNTTEESQASAPTVIGHQVGPEDTLFKIAQRYWGDGWLYPTLFEVNRGITQANGKPLNNPDLIIDGTVLSVPTVPPTGPNTIQHTVGANDTVASIARKVLGSEARSSEIQTLLKEGFLHPGEALTIPVSAPGTVQPSAEASYSSAPLSAERSSAPVEALAPTATETLAPVEELVSEPDPMGGPGQDAGGPQAPMPLAEQPVDSSSLDVAVQIEDRAEGPNLIEQLSNAATSMTGVEDGWSTRTTFGVGGVLAGGLVSLIGVRRGLQRRRRVRGGEMLMPSDVAARVEQELRTVGNPLAVSEVAKSLCGLATHFAAHGGSPPQIRAARLSDDFFEIHLVEPTALPAPWVGTSDQLIWVYQGQEVDRADICEIPAPYPTLVTIGQDERGVHILLDLEQVGELRVSGPRELVKDVLAALTIELATSSWADDLTVTVVGEFATIEDVLQTGRIKYLPTVGRLIDTLARRAASDRETLTKADLLDVRHARVARREPSTWYPEVVVLADPLTEEQQNQLNQILDSDRRVALAVVQVNDGPGEWSLELVSPTLALVEPLKMAIDPQRIDTAAYDQILDIVEITTRQPAPKGVTQTKPIWPERASMFEVSSEPEQPGMSAMLLGRAAESIGVPSVGPQDGQPYLRLFGPIELINAPGPVEVSFKARLTEYLAYLMLTGEITSEGIDEAIWPNRRNQNNSTVRDPATSRIRKWLGMTDEDSPRLEPRTYKVSDVGCDWNDFRTLTSGDLARVPTQYLEAAIGLVNGAPFNQCVGRNWAWAEAHRQQMIIRIVDACYELATRQLLDRKYLDCETALVVGLDIEPGDEQLWRMRILAAHARHNEQAVAEAMNRLYAQLGPLDSLEPETEQFLAAVKDHTPITELMEML